MHCCMVFVDIVEKDLIGLAENQSGLYRRSKDLRESLKSFYPQFNIQLA